MIIRYLLFFVFFLLISLTAFPTFAGGDYWEIRVQKKAVQSSTTTLKLLFIGNPESLFIGCKEFTVMVDYDAASKWTWLPFVSDSHPSKQETLNAIKFLNEAASKSYPVYFGYIGGGLHKSKNKQCIFESKGLRLIKMENKKNVIFSFYDPV